MTFQDKLKKMRQSRGWSQNRVAIAILDYPEVQVSKSKISDWEIGKFLPNLREIAVLSRVFGVAPQYWIVDEMEDPNPPYLSKDDEMTLRITRAAKVTPDQLIEILLKGREVASPTVSTREVAPKQGEVGPKKPPRRG
jgi:transcriptional regulator with XRE-family HTH domain